MGHAGKRRRLHPRPILRDAALRAAPQDDVDFVVRKIRFYRVVNRRRGATRLPHTPRHGEERRAAACLEPWATQASGAACTRGPSFETPRFARLLRMTWILWLGRFASTASSSAAPRAPWPTAGRST